jgi:hypothetical protein
MKTCPFCGDPIPPDPLNLRVCGKCFDKGLVPARFMEDARYMDLLNSLDGIHRQLAVLADHIEARDLPPKYLAATRAMLLRQEALEERLEAWIDPNYVYQEDDNESG